jgi:hypothetical protein
VSPILPPPDPSPVPGPVWLLKVLLYVTFLFHVLFMNLTFGGALLATVYGFKGKPKHLVAAWSLMRPMPYLIAFTITFGVAPLLFVQVLYGPLVYTAAILMGVPFILIIPALLLAYSLAYFCKNRWERLGSWRKVLSLLLFLLFGYVGFTYVNLFTLMLEPDRFHNKYLNHPGGLQMNLADPTIWPRFLHVLLGAVAVSGLWVAISGLRRLSLEPEQGRWQYRSGATWTAGATLVNFAAGAWWLLAIPREVMMIYMGGDALATGAFALGLACALATLVLVLLGINALKPKPYLMGSMHSLVLTLACMVVMRDRLRDAGLGAQYDVTKLPVSPQWGAILLFAGLFLSGAAVAAWLLRQGHKARRERKEREGQVLQGPGLMDSGLRRLSDADSGIFRGGLGDSSSGFRTGPGESGSRKAGPGESGGHRLD